MGTTALDARRTNIDRFYTGLSIGIAPDQLFIGDKILPVLMTPLSTEKIAAYGTEAWRMIDDLVGDFSMPARIDISMGKITIEVDGHALENPVSDRHQIESIRGPLQLDLETRALYVLKQRMLLRREKLQADLVQNPAVYTATTHVIDKNGAEWDTVVDPLDDIVTQVQLTIISGTGRMPNVFWCGAQVWAKLIQNAAIKNRIFGQFAPQSTPTTAQFANLIGVDAVLVGRAVSRSAAGVSTFLWGKNAGLAFVPPVAGQEVPAFGYTIEQSVFGNNSEAVNRIRDEHMGASGGWYLKRSHFYTPTITFKDAGTLFTNVVQ